MWLISLGTDGVTAVLIKNGAAVNLVDIHGNTPINLAIQFGIVLEKISP